MNYQKPYLPPNTIVPSNESLFIPYFINLYEDIAQTVNSKDINFYPMAISSIPTNIVNLPSFGAFIICVSGIDSSLPTLTASLCKSDANASGSVITLGSQAGTGFWTGNILAITSTSTSFQIAHNKTGVVGNFNIRIIGTQ